MEKSGANREEGELSQILHCRTNMKTSGTANNPIRQSANRAARQPINPLIHQSISPFFVLLLLLFVLIPLTGCVSKATADAEAKTAFLAGEKAAYQSIQVSQTAIVVLGEVQRHQVPWVAGLTLAQAIAAAGYTGAHDPTDIILKRNSVQTEFDPKRLLSGQDVPLHPGDVVSILSQ